jgi:hypothetical protein
MHGPGWLGGGFCVVHQASTAFPGLVGMHRMVHGLGLGGLGW